MSGDVFGNGMLLSKHIAAAGGLRSPPHLPRSEPGCGGELRASASGCSTLPRSSWDDYDAQADLARRRRLAALRQVDPARRRGAARCSASKPRRRRPIEVMRAILRMPVDLLWNGGIGTYVKAQRRVARRSAATAPTTPSAPTAGAARQGGRRRRQPRLLAARPRRIRARPAAALNTDFIDNSAGVNTSDVEVNIKILLNPTSMRSGQAHARRRATSCSRSMTNEVAGARAAQQLPAEPGDQHARAAVAPARLSEYQHLIRSLERGGRSQPRASNSCRRRRARRAAQARPRAHAAGARGGARLQQDLAQQSPARLRRAGRSVLRQRAASATSRRRCASAIRARFRGTACAARSSPPPPPTASSIAWGRCSWRARRKKPAPSPAAIARAYTDRARDLRHAHAVGATSRRSTTASPRSVQYGMMYQTSRLLRHASYWLLRERGKRSAHRQRGARVSRRRASSSTSGADIGIGGEARAQHDATLAELTAGGVPEKLARRVAQARRCSNPRSTSWRWRATSSVPRRRRRARLFRARRRARASTGCIARSTGSRSTAPGRPPRAPACATPRMRAHRELTQQVLRTRGAARADERRRALGVAARRGARELEAHAHRDARRRARPISPRSPWASKRCAISRAARREPCASRW